MPSAIMPKYLQRKQNYADFRNMERIENGI